MLTIIVATEDYQQAQKQLLNLSPEVEALEWRLDYLSDIQYDKITAICKQVNKPIILTLRRVKDGGFFKGNDEQHRHHLTQLAQCHADYLDIESDIDEAVLEQAAQYCSIIRSHHDFKQTPTDLNALLTTLRHPSASIIKLVTQGNSTLDSLRILICLASQPTGSLAAHCMGEDGLPSRFLGKIMGSAISYAQPDDDNTILPHLPTLADYQLHRHEQLNAHTKIYGLIGDPVSHSQGANFHNCYFTEHNINAVYIKMRIKKKELTDFFFYANQLNIKGLSITMPLKQAVIEFIDDSQLHVNAINTIAFNQITYGINTDGEGALLALQQATIINDKKILILGAGGSAIGLLAALRNEPYQQIDVYNRTQSKLTTLAQHYPIHCRSLAQAQQQQYDIIINTLPLQAQIALLNDLITLIESQTQSLVVMDIDYSPRDTPILKAAQQIGAKCVYGEAMFIEQAKLQQRYWQKND